MTLVGGSYENEDAQHRRVKNSFFDGFDAKRLAVDS